MKLVQPSLMAALVAVFRAALDNKIGKAPEEFFPVKETMEVFQRLSPAAQAGVAELIVALREEEERDAAEIAAEAMERR